MRSADIILPYLKERIDRLVWAPENKVEITTSLLGDNAALLGIHVRCQTIKKERCYEQDILMINLIYDKYPVVNVPGMEGECRVGWEAISDCLNKDLSQIDKK